MANQLKSTYVSGDLTVSGNINGTLKGTADSANSVNVTEADTSTATGVLTETDGTVNKSSVLKVSKNGVVVTGNETVSGNVNITGNVTAAAFSGDGSGLTGVKVAAENFDTTVKTSFGTNTTSDVNLGSTKNANTYIYAKNGVTVGSDETVTGNLSVSKNVDISGNLTVTGSATIGGGIVVNGTSTSINATNLSVKDTLIEIASGNTSKYTSYAGLVFPNYDGSATGGILMDGAGKIYVGDVTLGSTGLISSTNLTQIPSTVANLSSSSILKWDGSHIAAASKNTDYVGTDYLFKKIDTSGTITTGNLAIVANTGDYSITKSGITINNKAISGISTLSATGAITTNGNISSSGNIIATANVSAKDLIASNTVSAGNTTITTNTIQVGANTTKTVKIDGENSKIDAVTFNGNATTATMPLGFSTRVSSWTWGTLTSTNGYTQSTAWNDSLGGSIAFAANSTQMSVQIDGKYYQREGKYAVYDTSDAATASTESKLVLRDSSGSFAANVITTNSVATSLVAVSANPMTTTAGRVSALATNSSRLYSNGFVMSNPATTNDQGWIRVTGTSESDTILEIATGDDGGAGEQIVARQYTTANAIKYEAKILDKSGNSSIPGNLTLATNKLINVGANITINDNANLITVSTVKGNLNGNADSATLASTVVTEAITSNGYMAVLSNTKGNQAVKSIATIPVSASTIGSSEAKVNLHGNADTATLANTVVQNDIGTNTVTLAGIASSTVYKLDNISATSTELTIGSMSSNGVIKTLNLIETTPSTSSYYFPGAIELTVNANSNGTTGLKIVGNNPTDINSNTSVTSDILTAKLVPLQFSTNTNKVIRINTATTNADTSAVMLKYANGAIVQAISGVDYLANTDLKARYIDVDFVSGVTSSNNPRTSVTKDDTTYAYEYSYLPFAQYMSETGTSSVIGFDTNTNVFSVGANTSKGKILFEAPKSYTLVSSPTADSTFSDIVVQKEYRTANNSTSVYKKIIGRITNADYANKATLASTVEKGSLGNNGTANIALINATGSSTNKIVTNDAIKVETDSTGNMTIDSGISGKTLTFGGTVTTANNLAGTSKYAIPYQSDSGKTTYLSAPSTDSKQVVVYATANTAPSLLKYMDASGLVASNISTAAGTLVQRDSSGGIYANKVTAYGNLAISGTLNVTSTSASKIGNVTISGSTVTASTFSGTATAATKLSEARTFQIVANSSTNATTSVSSKLDGTVNIPLTKSMVTTALGYTPLQDSDAMNFEGTVDSSTISTLMANTAVVKGDIYIAKVNSNVTIAASYSATGEAVTVNYGDMLIASKSASANSPTTWYVVESNLDDAIEFTGNVNTISANAIPVFVSAKNQDLTNSGVTISGTTITAALNGNASTATSAGKLSSAKTITLSGDVTGSVSTDLSSSPTITTTIGSSKVTNSMLAGSITSDKISSLTASKITSGTIPSTVAFKMNTDLIFNSITYSDSEINSKGITWCGSTDYAYLRYSLAGSDAGNLKMILCDDDNVKFTINWSGNSLSKVTAGPIYTFGGTTLTASANINPGANATYAIGSSEKQYLNVYSSTFTGYLDGNAKSATKLATSQNFSLTGDVTATAVSFNGTGAVQLSTTIGTGAVTDAMLAGNISSDKITSLDASKVTPGTLGSSSNKFTNIYSTTFTGALEGNAKTATSATSAGSATTATKATNIISSGKGVPYNTAANTTAILTGANSSLLGYTSTDSTNLTNISYTTASTANTIVYRDGSGNFAANVITANKFSGPLSGNADTATKLSASKTITLSGDVTGSVSTDFSSSPTITTTIGSGKVTNSMLAGSITSDKISSLAASKVTAGTFGSGSYTFNGRVLTTGDSFSIGTNNGVTNVPISSSTQLSSPGYNRIFKNGMIITSACVASTTGTVTNHYGFMRVSDTSNTDSTYPTTMELGVGSNGGTVLVKQYGGGGKTLTLLDKSGNTSVPGELSVTGNISTTNGKLSSSTLATTGAATIGSTLGVTGATTLSSTLGVTGATTLSSTLGVTGATTLNSTLSVKGATTTYGILPATTTKYDIGSSTYKYSTIYASTFNGALSGNASSASVINHSAYAKSQNVNSYPYHLIAQVPIITTNWSDNTIIFMVEHAYNGGGFGIAKASMCTDNQSSAAAGSASIKWLECDSNLSLDCLQIGFGKTSSGCYLDVFWKSSGTYMRGKIYLLTKTGSWTMINSSEDSSTSITNCYASLAAAGTALHNQEYTSTASAEVPLQAGNLRLDKGWVYNSSTNTTGVYSTASKAIATDSSGAPTGITYTSASTGGTIVYRDSNGSFAANVITAVTFSGALSGKATLAGTADSATSATSATTASNIVSTGAGVPYNTKANTTSILTGSTSTILGYNASDSTNLTRISYTAANTASTIMYRNGDGDTNVRTLTASATVNAISVAASTVKVNINWTISKNSSGALVFSYA